MRFQPNVTDRTMSVREQVAGALPDVRQPLEHGSSQLGLSDADHLGGRRSLLRAALMTSVVLRS